MKAPQYAYSIVLCPGCGGKGHKSRHECTDYHRGEYDVVFSSCQICGGDGRLRQTVTTTFERLQHPQITE